MPPPGRARSLRVIAAKQGLQCVVVIHHRAEFIEDVLLLFEQTDGPPSLVRPTVPNDVPCSEMGRLSNEPLQSLPGAGRCLTSVGCPDDERQGEAHQHLKAHAHLPEDHLSAAESPCNISSPVPPNTGRANNRIVARSPPVRSDKPWRGDRLAAFVVTVGPLMLA